MMQMQTNQLSSGLTDLGSTNVHNSLNIGSLSCLIQQIFNDCILVIEPGTQHETDGNKVKSSCISNKCVALKVNTTYLIVTLQGTSRL